MKISKVLWGIYSGEEQAWLWLEARMPRWLQSLLVAVSLLITAALVALVLKIGLEAFATGVFPDYRP